MAVAILAGLGLFLAAYLVNTTLITVFYHRGLAHKAVVLRPGARRFVAALGIWLTGLDPKAWVCMHRAHHKHSDGPEDPHSPVRFGVFGVFLAQLRSYERCLVGLLRDEPEFTSLVPDIEFGVNVLNRKSLWLLPYLTHIALAVGLAVLTGYWFHGLAYFVGIMSHPLQGWMVNSLGHAFGGRNFATEDQSRNNHLAAWLIFGEGFQNNHHAFPSSAKFSYRRRELDLGYALCRLLQALGVLRIQIRTLIPGRGQPRPAPRPLAGLPR